jgi:hypothetical protein
LAIQLSPYEPCPACGALNLVGRNRCYQCGKELPELFQPDTAEKLPFWKRWLGQKRTVTRRFMRRKVEIPRTEIYVEGIGLQRATIQDIGLGGMKVRAESKWPIDSLVSVNLPLDGRELKLHGIVRYCRPLRGPNKGLFIIGVQFQNPPGPVVQRLLMRLGQ